MKPIISVPECVSESAGPRPPVLLDVRWQLGGPHGLPDYEAGHIPGAVFVDLDAELAGPAGSGGRHPLPDPEEFGAAMRRAGVSRDTPVVVYDGGQGWAAARAWWLLRWTGHPDVRVLDGGLAAWEGELSTETPTPAEGDFRPTPGALPLLDADGAAATARSGLLLDARAAERYRGDVEPIDRVGGHIPGAVSAPTSENSRRRRAVPARRGTGGPIQGARHGRRAGGRRLLRVRCLGRARGAGSGRRGDPRCTVCGLLVRVVRRRVPAGRQGPRSAVAASVPPVTGTAETASGRTGREHEGPYAAAYGPSSCHGHPGQSCFLRRVPKTISSQLGTAARRPGRTPSASAWRSVVPVSRSRWPTTARGISTSA